MPFTIIISIVIFLLLILFHEGGHFIAAKSVGIKVNEFAVGMGPKIWSKQTDETLYSLRALPIGGYCAMEGEEEESEDPRSFNNAKPWQRFVTILAGPLTNIVVAILTFSIFLWLSGSPSLKVGTIEDNSPATHAGLQVGDVIQEVNGTKVDAFAQVQTIIREAEGNPVEIKISRGGQSQTFQVVPQKGADQVYRIGFSAALESSFLGGLVGGFQMTFDFFGQLFQVLKQLFTGQLSMDAVGGPVAVVSMIGQAASNGFKDALFLFGYISVNLAFFNLLPIPALDGSKMLLILIEKLRGKPLNPEIEGRITMVGFVLLLSLILFVTIKDVIKLF